MRHTITAMRAGGQDEPKMFAGTFQDIRSLTVPVTELVAKRPSPQFAHAVSEIKPLHDLVQRDMSGAKKANAQIDLPRYISEHLDENGKWDGPVWKFDIWLPQPMVEVSNMGGFAEYEVDPNNLGFLLDAESRTFALESMYLNEEDSARRRAILEIPAIIQIYDGLDHLRAEQHFRDLNGLGVGITANLLLAHDHRDPWMRTTKKVFSELNVPLEQEARQVRAASSKILTVLAARTMVAAVARGIGAVQYGASSIPEETDGRPVDFQKLQIAAVTWLGFVFSSLGEKSFRDKGKILRSVPVLAALGAMGRPFYGDDPAGQDQAKARLLEIPDWSAGPRWSGVAGKVTARGFAVGSGKESGYAAYRALTDPSSELYDQVRGKRGSESRAPDDSLELGLDHSRRLSG